MLSLRQKLVLGTVVLVLSACVPTTTFTSTWKAPDAQAISPVGKTVAALFVTRDEGKRRAAEDILAADLTARGAHGIASYPWGRNGKRGKGELEKEKLKRPGTQGVVVMGEFEREQKIK